MKTSGASASSRSATTDDEEGPDTGYASASTDCSDRCSAGASKALCRTGSSCAGAALSEGKKREATQDPGHLADRTRVEESGSALVRLSTQVSTAAIDAFFAVPRNARSHSGHRKPARAILDFLFTVPAFLRFPTRSDHLHIACIHSSTRCIPQFGGPFPGQPGRSATRGRVRHA